MHTRIAALVLALTALGAFSGVAHEYLHCAGAGTPPWDCGLTLHQHTDHVLHASDYTPGDHAWVIPAQVAFFLTGAAGLVYGFRPRPATS